MDKIKDNPDNSLKNFFKKSKQNAIIVVALFVLAFLFYLLNPNFLNEFNIISMAQ